MTAAKPMVLIILDGWGDRKEKQANAIASARTPNWDQFVAQYPMTRLSASGEDVGLAAGQMGNSEVGHLNIGAGRVVYQDSVRISQSITNQDFQRQPVLIDLFERTRQSGGRLHLMGLVSDGGVHSLQDHAHALINLAAQHNCPTTVHAFLDGRDTPPKSAEAYLSALMHTVDKHPQIDIGSIMGRYFAMDRDKRWDRTAQAYFALTQHQTQYQAHDALSALHQAYARQETDEFVAPTIMHNTAPISAGDSICFFNFRADRARQLSQAFVSPDIDGFNRGAPISLSAFATMTEYMAGLTTDVIFGPQPLEAVLGAVLSQAGYTQLRLAETEKYAHVTFFMNGGQEEAFEKEDRLLIPSPKVATYDLQPEMSAQAVTDKLVGAIQRQSHDVIICNYANADMVGHTGDFDATVQAVETLDNCLGQVYAALQAVGGECLITADHGNADKMFDPKTQQPHTAHTHEKVPLLYIGRPLPFQSEGRLCDIAPTLLHLMGITPPSTMSGKILL